MSTVTEYFDYLHKYKEIYGENVVVLYQLGSFYELYGIDNSKEKLGNVQEVTQLLNIQLTRKNKSILENNRKNPLMCGIPCCSLEKYIPVLIDHNYIVVLIEQFINNENKITRKVTKVLSTGTIFHNGNDTDFNYITCILIEKLKNDNYIAGVCSIDVSLGNVFMFELNSNNKQSIIDKISFFLKSHHTSEVIIDTCFDEDYITNVLEIENVIVHYNKGFPKEFTTNKYQNDFLSKVYKNETQLSAIEYLDIERMGLSIVCFINVLNFIYRGNEEILCNLKHPVIYNPEEYLVLLNDTHHQLNIFNSGVSKNKCKYKCVFDVINKTKSIIGKRKLKNDLLFPIVNKTKLEERHNVIDELYKLNDTELEQIRLYLSRIYDVEKYYRKIGLNKLNPNEWYNLICSCNALIDIHKVINNIIFIDTTSITFFLEYVNHVFDFDELSKYNNLNDLKTGIKVGFNTDLDNLQAEYTTLYNSLTGIANNLSGLIDAKDIVKITFSDQYYLTTTNIRASAIKGKTDKFSFISNKSGTKISNNEINKISNKLVVLEAKIKSSIKESYISILQEIYINFSKFFNDIINVIGIIDTYINQVVVCKQFSYVKPNIVLHENSYVDIKGIRHPLIERINDNIKYISNDVYLGNESNIILFSLNGLGKSSLIKSIGICILLAQSGFYVPCNSMEICLFNTMIPRICGSDNILKNQSSFVVEMIELKMILKNANKRTCILLDELCSSTEYISGNALVAGAINYLNSKNSPFILASHIHWLAEYFKDNKHIKIKHLSVNFDKNNDIIYERKMLDGSGSSIYGLEVAKSLGLNAEFIKDAFAIRNSLIGKSDLLLNNKKSLYNKSKIVDSCEICDYKPKGKFELPLDTHHIEFQCNADTKGIIGNFHKNELFNLVILCKECHIKVHQSKINISGYIQTSKGRKLSYM
jgi:DNA mismatch repair protein MutS